MEMQKKPEKLMKIVNIDGENLCIFSNTWGISMAFSGKMWLMIIQKSPKTHGFTLSLEGTFLEKRQREGDQIDHPQSFKG